MIESPGKSPIDSQTDSSEFSVSGSALWMLPATLGVLGFYALCFGAMLWIGVLFLVDLAILLALARFGLTGIITPSLEALGRLAAVLARSLQLQNGAEYSLLLQREDAPRVFEIAESLASRMDVTPPSQIVLEMSNSAWVHLKGYSRKGTSRLGIGYDLMAVLREDELEAVLAHEMAHAKLVQRGYRGWLLNGLSRIAQQAYILREVLFESEANKKNFYTAKVLLRAGDALGKMVSRLAAAHSRRDEFAADRLGAQTTSPQAARRALLQTYLADSEKPLWWQERASRIEREEDYAAWLRSQLLPAGAEAREQRKTRALAATQNSEFDTHPPLRERLAALEKLAPMESFSALSLDASTSSPWAIELLADSNGLAARLARQIEEVSHGEERKHTEEATRWIRKNHRASGSRVAALILMVLAGGLALIFGIMAARGEISDPGAILVILVFFGLGLVLFLQTISYKAKLVLPIPQLCDWEAARRDIQIENDTHWLQNYTGENALRPMLQRRAQAKGTMSTLAFENKRAAVTHWSEAAYEALRCCNYAQAGAAAEKCLEIAPKNFEGRLAKAISDAAAGDERVLQSPLGEIIQHTGLKHSMSWAVGWALCLLGQWPQAEPYLLDAASQQSDSNTLHALAAWSQWHGGKMNEALHNARRAVEQHPNDWHTRVLLLRLLVNVGHVREASEVLKTLQERAPEEREVVVAALSFHALKDEREAALQCAEKLLSSPHEISFRLHVARALGEANLFDAARAALLQIREEVFCPEACVGLSHIAFEAKDYQAAASYAEEVLDISRPAYPDRSSQAIHFAAVFEGLTAITAQQHADPISQQPYSTECRAWLADFDLQDYFAYIRVRQLQLLLLFPDEASAHAHAQKIARALCPNCQSPLTFVLSSAPAEHQPDSPATPGVHGHRWL